MISVLGFYKLKELLKPELRLKKLSRLNRKEIAIVYFVYINPSRDWQNIVLGQLGEISRSGVLSLADLYVEVSNPFGVEGVESFFEKTAGFCIEIQFHDENRFEYWGVAKVWELAQESKKYKYAVYLHAKGMTSKEIGRNRAEKILTHRLFDEWKTKVKVLQENQKINKIGLFPGLEENYQGCKRLGGWVWFNFWWAKMDYVKKLREPKRDAKSRFYYERWLSFVESDYSNNFYDSYSSFSRCVSLYEGKDAIVKIRCMMSELE